ncbi:MAG TPA: lipopolysaccharide heptosyltransferase I [Burkholderiaceae bacterium]|nr:lipopolysaccharide heptosyltransferase I [Burkholderiaceae bacterium]
MRVLIVKTSSMGDVVHALPAVSDLAGHLPGAQIDWVVEEQFAEIPRLHRNVVRVIPISLRRWRGQLHLASTWRQIGDARRALSQDRYDTILDLQGLLKSAFLARWARGPVAGPCGRSARERAASWFYDRRFSVDPTLHAIDRNRLLAAQVFGYQPEGTIDFGIRMPKVATAALRPWIGDKRFALLLTNASRHSKLWPDENWRSIEAWLAEQGLTSVLVWGTERERAATLRRAAPMHTARLAPPAGLETLAAVCGRASLVIGLDTGLTHWAAAVGAPTVGIFCDYDPARVGLKVDERRVNLGGVADPPSSEDVIDAARHVLAAAAA